jgi:hypothetical protein
MCSGQMLGRHICTSTLSADELLAGPVRLFVARVVCITTGSCQCCYCQQRGTEERFMASESAQGLALEAILELTRTTSAASFCRHK